MALKRLFPPGYVFPRLDGQGPSAGGKVSFFLNETSTLATVYQDTDRTVADNPATLSATGRLPTRYFTDAAVRAQQVDSVALNSPQVFQEDDVGLIEQQLVYSTLAAAKAVVYEDGDSVYIKGFGRGFYDIASTTTADDRTVIAPDNGIGRIIIDLAPDATLADSGIIPGTSADLTTNLQARLDLGGTIDLPDGTYNFSGELNLSVANTILRGTRNCILNWTNTGAGAALRVAADDVRLQGFTLQGPHPIDTYLTSSAGIICNQTTYSPSVTVNYTFRLQVIDVAVNNIGQWAVRFDYVQEGRIEGCDIRDIGSHGIMLGAGCFDNVIHDNNVDNIKPGVFSESSTAPYYAAYGITVTRAQRSLTDAPISRRNRITNNRVTNVPGWNGIDSHGAKELLIANNMVQLCSLCIHMEDGDDAATSTYVPSQDIVITGNICIGNVGTTFEVSPGINLKGAGQSGATLQQGISVTNNLVINCGYSTTGLYTTPHGAIHAFQIKGLTISGNTIMTPQGIGLQLDGVEAATVIGNTFNAVAAVDGNQYGIWIPDGDVTATIDNNAFFGSSPQINIGAEAAAAGPDAGYSIEVGRNIHHGTATKYENIKNLQVWFGEYTTTERAGILNTPSGFILFNTTTSKLEVYNGTSYVELH